MKSQLLPATLTALKILQILKESSDQDHPIPQTELAQMLDVDRKTIARCLDVMEGYMGYEIEHTKTGVYLIPDDSAFELSEIRLLIDSVLASKVIDEKLSDAIVKKLALQLNEYDRRHVRHIHSYKQWSRTDNENVFLNIEALDDAITLKCQVSFDYYAISADKKMKLLGKQTVTPIQLVFSGGIYFVLAVVGDEEELRNFRIDRIKNVKRLENLPAKKLGISIEQDDIAAAYVEGHPYMSFGKSETIKLKIIRDDIGRLFDSFGTKVKISKFEIENNEPILNVELKANTQDMLLWALQNSDVAEVIAPQSLRDKLMQTLRNAKNIYLSTPADIYQAEMHKLTTGEALEEPENAEMDFSDIDLSQFSSYKHVDVSKYRFWKVNLQDISFVAGKKHLRCFYSFQNPIRDFSPLSDVPNLQDVSIIFGDIDSLEFVSKCRCLRSLTIGGAKVKDASAMYQTLSPQLDILKLFNGTEIDVELFKQYNPATKVIVGRKEAEDQLNALHYKFDVDLRFDAFPYPMNVVDEVLGLSYYGATKEEITEIENKILADSKLLVRIEKELFKDAKSKDIIYSLYCEGHSILEVACKFSVSIKEVLHQKRRAVEHLYIKELSDMRREFVSKHPNTGSVSAEDVQWFKDLMSNYALEQNRKKYF